MSGKKEISAQEVIRDLFKQIEQYEEPYSKQSSREKIPQSAKNIDAALLQYTLLLSHAYYLSPRSETKTRLNKLIPRLITQMSHSYQIPQVSQEALKGALTLASPVVIDEDKTPFDIAKIMIQQSFAVLEAALSAEVACEIDLPKKASELICLLDEVDVACKALPETARNHVDNTPTTVPVIELELPSPNAASATSVATSSTDPGPATLARPHDGILYPPSALALDSSTAASSSVPVLSGSVAVSSSSNSAPPSRGLESFFNFLRNPLSDSERRHTGSLYPILPPLPGGGSKAVPPRSEPVVSSLIPSSGAPVQSSNETSQAGLFARNNSLSSSPPVVTSDLRYREEISEPRGHEGHLLPQFPEVPTVIPQLPDAPATSSSQTAEASRTLLPSF